MNIHNQNVQPKENVVIIKFVEVNSLALSSFLDFTIVRVVRLQPNNCHQESSKAALGVDKHMTNVSIRQPKSEDNSMVRILIGLVSKYSLESTVEKD